MAYILGVGSFGNDVRRLQEYLNMEFSASLALLGGHFTTKDGMHFEVAAESL